MKTLSLARFPLLPFLLFFLRSFFLRSPAAVYGRLNSRCVRRASERSSCVLVSRWMDREWLPCRAEPARGREGRPSGGTTAISTSPFFLQSLSKSCCLSLPSLPPSLPHSLPPTARDRPAGCRSASSACTASLTFISSPDAFLSMHWVGGQHVKSKNVFPKSP